MFFTDFARRPIDENNPSGSNPNGSEDFDEIKRQINNLNKVTGRVSWKTVQTLSKKILSTQAKDLRCCCYFTVASTYNDGLRGLVEGLNSILDVCVVYWFNAYPEHSKSKARMSAIEWMVEHTEKRINKHRALPEELPLIEAAHQLCLRIEEELRLHYGIEAPSLGRIRRILNQWIEQIKEQQIAAELREKKQANTSAPAATQKAPEIKVNVSPSPVPVSSPNLNSQEKASPAKSGRFMIYFVIGLIVTAICSHFMYEQQRYRTLEQKINQASLNELVNLVASLDYENKKYAQSLKTQAINRVDIMMNNWFLDSAKVSNVSELDSLTNELIAIYPDSSSAQQLRQNFLTQSAHLEDQFMDVYKRFSDARTVFANVARQNVDKNSEKAYEYSNSLFPLLGRIEYAEKYSQQKEIDRATLLLNIYLYKLSQLQAEKTDNK
ncbi:type VI secretion system ImpA family N-terminal domain-containing protein [Vibrio alginolyticus]|uniref:type VI secretion system ImpA family N-terminal domain-containing protein n=1 Tax=Vibrio TaxID=662 RepID=UPI0006A60048|nr:MULTISPECIES: type VI secretion system ImpA family N-terminal domain-containing protein [Vibrio]QIR91079.1 type VI secretion protein [Vibrio diabolicus]EGQ7646982.1 type VI secretion protein [Vibrio alginolyticus]EHD0131681.1 type VI secretion protein [Vibrio alginolyticus]EHK9548766.1 type VI secretion system ImpA family N-terminal domain-containing protein [Vibrio alginolyticus]EHK9605074.1 type VI secretion system ImpA family N-terminal domain-containing protein [Vibrio alginolyticus]